MSRVTEIYGSMVFSDSAMKERLPKDTYQTIQHTIKEGKHLDINVANAVANAMKDWAIEKGATHFTHWFQPMTGVTAEKHDSFISPTDDGKVLMEFSGKELVRGESDASSFPSGGLRATFEARGYTAWDATSPAFVKDHTLYIPTAFCSYGGYALDKKTPLLRSMEDISKQAVRILRLFGNDKVNQVKTTVGSEQEYFLIDRNVYDKREDLIITGRTLFGSKAPKGQELSDHYFGSIKSRVAGFMQELDDELWKLGISARTEHNEVAPGQHELAPIYETTNIAADHNQLTMDLMKRIARKHDMVCLLAEKPFDGVNGSGKHNNWSLQTDTGINLLEPGDTPFDNAQFLLFLCAVIKAVDEYQDLLRISVASAGNDHRLGASEAPPAIMSIYVGEELNEVLEAIRNNTSYGGKEKTLFKVGVHTLPRFPKDTTDRNRTSPFAFTGNKFEFRALGSNSSISDVNTVLNTIVSEELRQFADELESSENFPVQLHTLIHRVVKEHMRIVFNGNGYDEEWTKEAENRGLLNLKTTVDALPYFLKEKNINLMSSHKVLSKEEMQSRYEIMLDNYTSVINIEALTMIDMSRKQIMPAVCAFSKSLSESIYYKGEDKASKYELTTRSELDGYLDDMLSMTSKLETLVSGKKAPSDTLKKAQFYKDNVIPVMEKLRMYADKLENLTDRNYWPFPTYSDILFSVQ